MLAAQVWRTGATLIARGTQTTPCANAVRFLSNRFVGASLYNSPLVGCALDGRNDVTKHGLLMVSPALGAFGYDFTARRGFASKVNRNKGSKSSKGFAYKVKKPRKDTRTHVPPPGDDEYDDMEMDHEDPSKDRRKPWQKANDNRSKDEVAAGWVLNEQIRDRLVNVVYEDGTMKKNQSKFRALEEARAMGLDLIKVANTKEGAICKMFNVKQRLYELKKKNKKNKPKADKEMRFSAKTEAHDIQVKSNRVMEFLSKGHPVKLVVKYNFDNPPRAKAEEVMNQLVNIFESVAVMGSMKQQFNAVSMHLTPKSKK